MRLWRTSALTGCAAARSAKTEGLVRAGTCTKARKVEQQFRPLSGHSCNFGQRPHRFRPTNSRKIQSFLLAHSCLMLA